MLVKSSAAVRRTVASRNLTTAPSRVRRNYRQAKVLDWLELISSRRSPRLASGTRASSALGVGSDTEGLNRQTIPPPPRVTCSQTRSGPLSDSGYSLAEYLL